MVILWQMQDNPDVVQYEDTTGYALDNTRPY